MKPYEHARQDLRYRMVQMATLSLILNLCYAIYHGVLGLLGHSWWMIALCAYYIILGATRFAAVLCERKNGRAPSFETELFVLKVCGMLLVALGCVLAGVNYISLKENIATRYDTITMIALATYTFADLTMAIIRFVRYHSQPSPLLSAIRRIGYAEVLVSVVTLQRSMLISFGDMPSDTVSLMNVLTSTVVYLMVTLMGIQMIKESRKKKWILLNSSKPMKRSRKK